MDIGDACYICRDYFELFTPGKLQEMLQARPGPFGPATQGGQIGTSLMMVVPSLMTSSPSPQAYARAADSTLRPDCLQLRLAIQAMRGTSIRALQYRKLH
ncbi:hypothetical protein [Rhodanobacter sp. 7MK24]|uniref:hypothetical protein n=1 Tax=Rhodanobacter sp. 7MK24 TaxID=2775922 RepID=UPI001CE05BDB|nr:hypothetical protein [Rhodanobacter sp. 7MK24]